MDANTPWHQVHAVINTTNAVGYQNSATSTATLTLDEAYYILIAVQTGVGRSWTLNGHFTIDSVDTFSNVQGTADPEIVAAGTVADIRSYVVRFTAQTTNPSLSASHANTWGVEWQFCDGYASSQLVGDTGQVFQNADSGIAMQSYVGRWRGNAGFEDTIGWAWEVPEPVPPGIPTNLTARTVDSSSINVSWSYVGNATGYKVYASQTSLFTPGPETFKASTTLNYSVVTGLNDNTLYFFKVVSVNAAGDSSPAGPVNATTSRLFRPLFGDDGAIWGGDRDGLAGEVGISGDALGILFGLIVTLMFAAAGFGFFQLPGGVIGGAGGFALAGVWGFFPLWLILFVVVAAVGAFFLWRGRGE